MLRRSFRALGLVAATALTLTAVPATADAQVLDPLGRPTEPVLGSLEGIASQPFVSPEMRDSIKKLVAFYRGGGDGKGAPIPTNGPIISQFAWPTVMQNCIGGTQSSVGTATAVPGPAALPLPGVPAHQSAFVFTALGTGKVAPVQSSPITVTWLNTSNGRSGTTPLTYTGVNPDGPATVNAVADTGPGLVLLALQGTLDTEIPGGVAHCTPFPTLGSVQVG